jgi:hypothetical protein
MVLETLYIRSNMFEQFDESYFDIALKQKYYKIHPYDGTQIVNNIHIKTVKQLNSMNQD